MHSHHSALAERETVKPLAQIVWDRRATTHFDDTPVPESEIETMLALAAQAPSGFNLQPWRFVVVRDPENRARLRRAANDQGKITEAPVVIVAFARRRAWHEHADEIFSAAVEKGAIEEHEAGEMKRDALAFVSKMPISVWLNRHVMIAFSYLMLAAESLGWDTAPMEGFDPAAVREAVGLPDDAEVVALLAVGRHREPDRPHPGRLDLSQLVFAERYDSPWAESTG